jgi:hypothetical protein
MKYEFDDHDLELIEKCKEAVEYNEEGHPIKDVLDEDDFLWLVYLLVDIVKAENTQ